MSDDDRKTASSRYLSPVIEVADVKTVELTQTTTEVKLGRAFTPRRELRDLRGSKNNMQFAFLKIFIQR